MNKKLIALAVLVLALVLAYMAYIKMMDKKSNRANNPNQPKSSENYTMKTVDYSKTPDKLPTDLPIEKDAKITDNYNLTTKDGRFQATRAYISTKSITDLNTLYKDYLTKGGYKIAATTDKPAYKMLFGQKGDTFLEVTINDNSSLKARTVNITYSESIIKQTK